MSRRRRPPRDERPQPAAPQSRSRWGLLPTLGVALGVFAAVTLIAWAAGAANLGTALGIGQVAFAVTVVWLMVFR